MKSEYMLNEYQKAEIIHIERQIQCLERQIFELRKRKADIYQISPIRYITETPEEVEQINKIINENNIMEMLKVTFNKSEAINE